MDSKKQMNRLVQGDVGSGKTIVAMGGMYKAVENGYQAVIMVPTEILARQHFDLMESMFAKYGYRVDLLIGNIKSKDKSQILERIKKGESYIVVGTHAIIQDNVEFYNLGLVVTDEQHRFGVKQRASLAQKGHKPDTLVMTATPIPRTLALILYGDLDISIIDELPPGRKEIETYAVGLDMGQRVHNFIKKQVDEGRQAYVVTPLIEESETLSVKASEELYESFKNDIFKDYSVGILHGKMPSKDKDSVMEDFKDKKIEILVSTTVIEVGVNVPNANIMVIYNAERFGLSQLHQLRGRVGRGSYQSYCILINGSDSKVSRDRMRIMQGSTDGFVISEKDLELRGPGDFFGTRQHGIPELKIANLFTDIDILKLVQALALEILDIDPKLESDKHLKIKEKIGDTFSDLGQNLIFN